jgi:hypothetical protein
MNNATLFRCVALLSIPLALAGCRTAYDVQVRNMTDQPVTARLYTLGSTSGKPYELRTGRAGPGDRTSLATSVDFRERVHLEVDFAGNIGHPATLDLDRGRTIVNVRRADEGARGRITLEEVPRP